MPTIRTMRLRVPDEGSPVRWRPIAGRATLVHPAGVADLLTALAAAD